MARARNIKPGFFMNEKLAELPPLTRILFGGLWTIADRAGRLEDRPKWIKANVLPYDDHDVDQALQALHHAGFVIRYRIAEASYIQIVNFTKHQNPHIKEAASTIPAPEQHTTSTVQAPAQTGTSPADSLSLDSLLLIPDSDTPTEIQKGVGDASPRKRGSRLPAGWQPSEELQTWATQKRPDLDPAETLARFTDYWLAKSGQHARKMDWDATYRNWIRDERKTRRQSGNGTGRETVPERIERQADAARRRVAAGAGIGDAVATTERDVRDGVH